MHTRAVLLDRQDQVSPESGDADLLGGVDQMDAIGISESAISQPLGNMVRKTMLHGRFTSAEISRKIAINISIESRNSSGRGQSTN